ncbi:MAG: glycosyltransferase family 4 protein [Nitrospiraceae bacterium]|nr:glycosyltransferase family 4 protein [Nitrospiraceae bacterium]
MKILQIIYESYGSPFGFGGAGVRAYELYRRLKDRHDITLLCMKYPGARDGEIEGLNHIFAGTESPSLAKSVLAYTAGAAAYVRRHGDDFDVIVENFLPSTPFFSRFLTRTPVLLQIQGLWGRHYTKKFGPGFGLPMFLMEKIYLRLHRRFLLVTEVNMGAVTGRAGRCFVIPNGIDRALLETPAQEGDYILFLSRIDTYHKGLDLLMDAFAGLASEFDALRLVLAGHESNPVEGLRRRLPEALRPRVEYAGFVSGEDKRRLLAGAAVFVLPSRIEAQPISIIEAMACGRPLVVSDIPELGFVTAEHAGLDFPSGSAAGLKERLALLLRDRDLRLSLGRNGRAYAGRFLWDVLALQFENALQLTADGKD